MSKSNYDPKEIEARIQAWWKTERIYRFDPEDQTRPVFSIDNPPRYASGALHAGHCVNYTQIDFMARYKRMHGHNVFFPLCFDTNGTPIEVKVEKKYDIALHETNRQEFIALCRKFANSFIEEMTLQFEILGESMDPDIYYQTDADYYRRITQISFIRMFEKGLIYKGNFPINWCTRCRTAISDAEVVYEKRKTKMAYIRFRLASKDGSGDTGEKVTIATTRPELLCTCQLVAVHGEDQEKGHLIDKMLLTPVFDRQVKVVADPKVDPSFGTGVVMICSIGDKEDLEWIYKYDLSFEEGIDKDGRMTKIAGPLEGLTTSEAKEKMIQEIERAGLLAKVEELDQNVGVCWRCDTPIEFIQSPQWFLKILDFKEAVLKRANEIRWFPEYMKVRLKDWVDSLAWDWAISRQRYFANPIPLWECTSCDKVVLPKEEDCYIDPTIDPPPVDKCPSCGGELEGCKDVFDTWMDSSITPLYNTFWQRDGEKFANLFPMSLRPQSQDIIRTWAFYTILREHLLVDERPWDDVLIGAYILDPEGKPMHASKGNVIDPIELLEKYHTDAVRFWVATCGIGADASVSFQDISHGQKLCTKMYNAIGLAAKGFHGRPTKGYDELRDSLHDVDRWVLSKYTRLVDLCTELWEKYEFERATKEADYFFWHEFADHYLELIKHRIYSESDEGLAFTLYTVALGMTKLFAPVMPHITEEVYLIHFKAHEGDKSLHISSWPQVDFKDPEGEESGEIVKGLVEATRRWKSSQGISLGAQLPEAIVVTPKPSVLMRNLDDISRTCKFESLEVSDTGIEKKAIGFAPRYKSLGPSFRSKSKEIGEKLKGQKGDDLEGKVEALEGKGFELALEDGSTVTITKEHIDIEYVSTFKGQEVKTISFGDIVIGVKK